MLVLTRYRVPAGESVDFRERARLALTTLTARTGCLSGYLGRSVDEPDLWTLTTTWTSVGDYRRALSNHEVKLHAVPLMYASIDEPSAFEELLAWQPSSGLQEFDSDLA